MLFGKMAAILTSGDGLPYLMPLSEGSIGGYNTQTSIYDTVIGSGNNNQQGATLMNHDE